MKKKYTITAAICLGLAIWYCVDCGVPGEQYRTLCDGFTIPGVLCLCAGGLLWAGKRGAFCGIGYCLQVTKNAFLPGKQETKTYYDYVRHRPKNRTSGYGFLFVCGSVCMAVALVFLWIDKGNLPW